MEEIKDRKAFNFYRSYWEVAQMLNNKNRLAFFDALLSREFTGVEPTFDGVEQANFAWVSQKHSIDSQIDGWINKKIAISKQPTTPSLPPTEPPSLPPSLPPTLLPIIPPSVQEKEKEKEKEEVKEEEEIITPKFNFKKSLISLGIEDSIVKDWLIVRKQKKLSNTETAFTAIRKNIEESGMSANECITIAVERSWGGFKASWITNNSTEKPSAYKEKTEIQPIALHDYERFNNVLRNHPILGTVNNVLNEREYREMKMSYDEMVSLLPLIAAKEERKGIYLELILERDRKAYYAKKELENQLNTAV